MESCSFVRSLIARDGLIFGGSGEDQLSERVGNMSATRRVRSAMLLAAAGAALALPANRADAAAIAVYDGTAPSSGGHTWTYRVSLPQGVRVAPGDFLTIFDFGGFTGVQSAPANW